MSSISLNTNNFGKCSVSFEGAYKSNDFCFNDWKYHSDYNGVDFSYYIGEELIEKNHRFTENEENFKIYL